MCINTHTHSVVCLTHSLLQQNVTVPHAPLKLSYIIFSFVCMCLCAETWLCVHFTEDKFDAVLQTPPTFPLESRSLIGQGCWQVSRLDSHKCQESTCLCLSSPHWDYSWDYEGMRECHHTWLSWPWLPGISTWSSHLQSKCFPLGHVLLINKGKVWQILSVLPGPLPWLKHLKMYASGLKYWVEFNYMLSFHCFL